MTDRRNVWDQLRKLTPARLAAAIEKDGGIFEGRAGAVRAYRYPDGRRVTVHFHLGKGYGPKLLKGLLERDLGWTEDDLRRLGLVD